MQIGWKKSGFSLVEVMVTMGLLGVVVIGVLNIGKLQQVSTTSSKGAGDLLSALISINSLLVEPLSCSQNFNGTPVNLDEEIHHLVGSSGTVNLFSKNETFGNGAYKVLKMWVGKYDVLTGRAEFKVHFELVKQANLTKGMIKTLYFYPKVESGNIVSCLKGVANRAEGLLKKMCFDVDPAGTCTYINILKEAKERFCKENPWIGWDDVNKKCKVLDSGKICGFSGGKPLFFLGYNSHGELDCGLKPTKTSDENYSGKCGVDANSCLTGDLQDLPDSSGQFKWNCNGSGSGSNIACKKSIGSKVIDGECSRPEKASDCLSGISDSSIAGTITHYRWNCLGVNGGADMSCSEKKPLANVIPLCGIVNNDCIAGALNDTGDSTENYLWVCNGSPAGNDVSCSVSKSAPVQGKCVTPTITENTCASGNLENVADTDSNFMWNCKGSGGGGHESCSLTKETVCLDSFATEALCLTTYPTCAQKSALYSWRAIETNKFISPTCGGTSYPGVCSYSTGSQTTPGRMQPSKVCDGTVRGITSNCSWCDNKASPNGLYSSKFYCHELSAWCGSSSSPKIDGSCDSSVNKCLAGSFRDIADTTTEYKWECVGSNGGASKTCSEPLPSTPNPPPGPSNLTPSTVPNNYAI